MWNISRSYAINWLNNSKFDVKAPLYIIARKIWALVRKKHPLKWLKKEHLEEHVLEIFIPVLIIDCAERNIDSKYYCLDYYDASVSKYGVRCGISLIFWENKGRIKFIDPYGWF